VTKVPSRLTQLIIVLISEKKDNFLRYTHSFDFFFFPGNFCSNWFSFWNFRNFEFNDSFFENSTISGLFLNYSQEIFELVVPSRKFRKFWLNGKRSVSLISNYIIYRVILAFWSVLIYDPLGTEVKTSIPFSCFAFVVIFLLYKTSRFHVAVHLFSDCQNVVRISEKIHSWVSFYFLREYGAPLLRKKTMTRSPS